MPNWIYSDIIIKSKNKGELRNFLDSGERKDSSDNYTLDSWIPMPSIFNSYDTTNIHSADLKIGQEVYMKGEKSIVTEEMIRDWEAVEQYQMSKYGCVGWYNWSCKYWGTKWNADIENLYLSPDGLRLTASCTTAWDPPMAFFCEISRRFPDVVIDVKSHDEGGWNYWYILTGGVCSNSLITLCDEYVIKKIENIINEDEEISPEIKDKRLKEIRRGTYYDVLCLGDEELREYYDYICSSRLKDEGDVGEN